MSRVMSEISNFDLKLTSDSKIQPPITDRTRKAVAFYFSRYGHALVTFYFQFLCSDCSEI